MTEYDLETKKALRRVSLLEYGFGPETLWGRKICPACGSGWPELSIHSSVIRPTAQGNTVWVR